MLSFKAVRTATTVALCICIAAAVGLFVASFVVPPTGVIDASVLRAVAMLFGFASLAVVREAIREGIGAKLTHGNTSIEIRDLDGNPEIDQGTRRGEVQQP